MDKISITKVTLRYLCSKLFLEPELNRVGIASVIVIFIQGFRSFASTFSAKPTPEEREISNKGKKRKIRRSEKTVVA